MKLKLWHLILQKIVKVSSGQKNQTFCQIYMKKSFLSLPITFSVLVNVIPYQIFIQNTEITVSKMFSTKFGALPLLQECPPSLRPQVMFLFGFPPAMQHVSGLQSYLMHSLPFTAYGCIKSYLLHK